MMPRPWSPVPLVNKAKLNAVDLAPSSHEREGYRCAAQRTRGDGTFSCSGRMHLTYDVVTRDETVTCDTCGRIALAEPADPDTMLDGPPFVT